MFFYYVITYKYIYIYMYYERKNNKERTEINKLMVDLKQEKL